LEEDQVPEHAEAYALHLVRELSDLVEERLKHDGLESVEQAWVKLAHPPVAYPVKEYPVQVEKGQVTADAFYPRLPLLLLVRFWADED
jgi:hypothetical protein